MAAGGGFHALNVFYLRFKISNIPAAVIRDVTHQADEAGAVDARPTTAEKAQNGDRTTNQNENGRKFLKERQKAGTGDCAQQVDIDGRLLINMHPETES